MRRFAVRALILAAALTTLAVPVFHVTGSPGLGAIPTASACSNVGCVISSTIPAQIETFVSPITVSATTSTFAERATSAQVTGSLSLPGTVGFTVYDLRGNNQGWVASLTASGFSSSLFPLSTIPASALTVSGKPTVTMTCLGPLGPGGVNTCGMGLGVTSTADLSTAPAVAVECPFEAIGEGVYAVSVPLLLTIPNGPPGFQAEKFASFPASWFGTFTVGVMEGQPVPSFTSFGCPPFSTASVTPTATTVPPTGGCVLSSKLVGTQETPPTASPAVGSSVLTVDPAAGQIRFSLSVAGLVAGATAAHIHQAPPGVAGSIVVPLPLDGALGQTSFMLSGSGTPQQGFDLTQLCTNPAGFYVNVHSTVYPEGEIRGQLVSGATPAG